MRTISEDSLLTMVFLFLSHRVGTVQVPVYSGFANAYAWCSHSQPLISSRLAPGNPSWKRQPSLRSSGRAEAIEIIPSSPLSFLKISVRCAQGQLQAI